MAEAPALKNQLANAASPYLRQHANNPVHWQIWSDQTLDLAQSVNKPILLSIGYAACHWCHVMAHESFENQQIAEQMNLLFVNIKVDREERPDIDQIYMSALHATGEQGGWPLTMFLTPHGLPFWGGTYFPPTPRFGRPGFPQVLNSVANAWRRNKTAVNGNAEALKAHLQAQSKPPQPAAAPATDLPFEISDRLMSAFDQQFGGLAGAPKFPNAPVLELWAKSAVLRRNQSVENAFVETVRQISNGGIYDHLAGGIARYSTDERWLAPHFEKMLYDNAHYLRHLCWAWQFTGDDLFKQRALQTVNWLESEMMLEGGGFAASLDADSEGEEGRFYVWQSSEIAEVLGKQYGNFAKHYDVTENGNWEGKTILNRSGSPKLLSKAMENSLADCRQKLLTRRANRVRPGLDDKILTDWNGYIIRALAEVGFVFESTKASKMATDAFRFITESMRKNPDNGYQLFHSRLGDQTNQISLATDYAALANAALTLYETTAKEAYLDHAQFWLEILQREFTDHNGGYYLLAEGQLDVITRPRADADEANPAASAQILETLSRYSALSSDSSTLQSAVDLAANINAATASIGQAQIGFMAALLTLNHLSQVVVIAKDDTIRKQFTDILRTSPAPIRSITIVGSANQLPAAHQARNTTNHNAAYICENQTCSLPIETPGQLKTVLSQNRSK